MKTKIGLFAFFLLAFITACEKTTGEDSVSDTLQSGDWRISFFEDSGHNETDSFALYSFTFSYENLLIANNGEGSINGFWTTTGDLDNAQLVLDFGLDPPLSKLNNDWDVMEKTATKVHTQHLSEDSIGGIEYLTFLKN